MKFHLMGVVVLMAASAWIGGSEARAADRTQINVDVHVEVLTRGPVHEAFAEAVVYEPQPGIVVAKAPPEPIEELPPEQRPEGENVVWIPGYAAWDDERDDFIWVSGVWRELPPGRQWVSGYWARTDGGIQWTYGYWADVEITEVEYLSEPPEVIKEGPTLEAPSADYTWVSGCWVWRSERYVWRPGHWVMVKPDWDWVPAHYVWTPRGYIFVEGYWDYTVTRRGVMFAPVYFDAVVYGRPGFSYSPVTVIDVDVFSEHLFLRPSHCHYYFGDYYAVGYYDAGFLPAHSFHVSRRGYDPIYARAHWQHRHDLDWGRNIEARFVYRREHEEARPPRTLSAQIKLASNKDIRTQKSLIFAESLWKVSKSQSGPTRFRPVDAEERKSLVAKTKEVRRFGVERQILETGPAGASRERSTMGTERGKVRMPASPILAKKGMSSKAQVLPPQPQLSELDTTVEPKPRKSAARRESTEAAPVMQKKSRVEPGTKPTMGLKTKAKPNEEAKDNPGRDANRDSAAAPKGEPNESKIESKNKAKKGSKAKQESKSKEDEP